jgi:hypothetical protein
MVSNTAVSQLTSEDYYLCATVLSTNNLQGMPVLQQHRASWGTGGSSQQQSLPRKTYSPM